MNEKRIAFILCTNHKVYEEECKKYIDSLIIPKGFEIEIIPIYGAKSMTSGYNTGMKMTDAKYKVYLHQDLFIINKNFIRDILQVFADSRIGMIGMVGNVELTETVRPWDALRVGIIYSNRILTSQVSDYLAPVSPYSEVVCIDGMLMATQYDIPWREDIFKAWDFYDLSQSMEFRKRGYKVVVPYMEEQWVLHDDGVFNLSNYEHEREIFKHEYLA